MESRPSARLSIHTYSILFFIRTSCGHYNIMVLFQREFFFYHILVICFFLYHSSSSILFDILWSFLCSPFVFILFGDHRRCHLSPPPLKSVICLLSSNALELVVMLLVMMMMVMMMLMSQLMMVASDLVDSFAFQFFFGQQMWKFCLFV